MLSRTHLQDSLTYQSLEERVLRAFLLVIFWGSTDAQHQRKKHPILSQKLTSRDICMRFLYRGLGLREKKRATILPNSPAAVYFYIKFENVELLGFVNGFLIVLHIMSYCGFPLII